MDTLVGNEWILIVSDCSFIRFIPSFASQFICSYLHSLKTTRLLFQKKYVHPENCGTNSNLTNIFQMEWNHQLDNMTPETRWLGDDLLRIST